MFLFDHLVGQSLCDALYGNHNWQPPLNNPPAKSLAPDGLLTEEQAGRIAGVSRKQIRKMILAGRLEAADYGTGKRKHYRIKADALASLQSRPCEPLPAPRQRRCRAAAFSVQSIFPRV